MINKKLFKYIMIVTMSLLIIHVITCKISIRSKIDIENTSNMSTYQTLNKIKGVANYIRSDSTSYNNYINLSEPDIYELATLVYLESGSESYECQKAVASVVINRMTYYDKSLQNIIYEYNQFEPAYLIATSTPSDSTLSAVRDVIKNGPNIPTYVTYFRADYYHKWSDDLINYNCIDNTYFSYDKSIKERLECLQ